MSEGAVFQIIAGWGYPLLGSDDPVSIETPNAA
jgi:hypothetical protein